MTGTELLARWEDQNTRALAKLEVLDTLADQVMSALTQAGRD